MNLAFWTWGSLNLYRVNLRHSVHLFNTTFLTSRCIGNLWLCSKRLANRKDCEVEINLSYFPGCLSIDAKQRWKETLLHPRKLEDCAVLGDQGHGKLSNRDWVPSALWVGEAGSGGEHLSCKLLERSRWEDGKFKADLGYSEFKASLGIQVRPHVKKKVKWDGRDTSQW